MSDPGSERGVEWFQPTSGTIVGWLGVATGVVMVALSFGWGLTEGFSLPGFAGGLLLALAAWVTMLRPRVGLDRSDLVVRGMVSTTRLPVGAIESVVARQVLAVWVGGKRYVSAAVGHSYRDIARSRRQRHDDPALLRQNAKHSDPIYADHVVTMITERARLVRSEAGGDLKTPLPVEPGGVRRSWAWPEIAALVVLAVLLAVGIAL